ncbi:Crp/Fnr family transcriptional regulator [Cyanobacteria bacterium FACHB-63]|nr:Crp/Fnr family transcriptional regulator [Cyanobacteria bacterium FACHB-63]
MRDSIDFSNVDQLPIQLQSVLTYQVLETGEHLFHQGEVATTLFAIKTGRVRLLHYTESGQVLNHYQVMVGEVLAEVILFLDHYACSAIAAERTEVLVFPKPAFLAALQHSPNFATSFMAQIAQRLHITKVMLELRGIHSARDRVLHYLRFIIPPDQKSIVLEQPLKAIAYDLGISPESLSRALTQLENEGMIERDKRSLRLI